MSNQPRHAILQVAAANRHTSYSNLITMPVNRFQIGVARAAALEQATDESAPSTSSEERAGASSGRTNHESRMSSGHTASFPSRSGLLDAAGRLMLKNLTLPELEEWCVSIGKRMVCAADGSSGGAVNG